MTPYQIYGFALEMEKQADISPELIGALLGAGGAGAAGYGLTDDPRKKVRNALLAALAGGAGGYALGGQFSPDAAPAPVRRYVDPVTGLQTDRAGVSTAQRTLDAARDRAQRELERLSSAATPVVGPNY